MQLHIYGRAHFTKDPRKNGGHALLYTQQAQQRIKINFNYNNFALLPDSSCLEQAECEWHFTLEPTTTLVS